MLTPELLARAAVAEPDWCNCELASGEINFDRLRFHIASAIRAAVEADRNETQIKIGQAFKEGVERCAAELHKIAVQLRANAKRAIDDEEQLQLQARANHLDFIASQFLHMDE